MAKNILVVGFSAAPPEWRERMGKMFGEFGKLPNVVVRKANAPKGWAWATVKWGERPEGDESRNMAFLPQDYNKVKELYRKLRAPKVVAIPQPSQPSLRVVHQGEPVRLGKKGEICPHCEGMGKVVMMGQGKTLVGKCYACRGTGRFVAGPGGAQL